MKFQALIYGEFFQGKISLYNHKRPISVNFLECVEQKKGKWRVEFTPKHGLNPGVVIELDNNVLCEILGKRGVSRYVRILN